MFRHGLRAEEAHLLKWNAVMVAARSISITRLKGSMGGVHRLQADELEALVALRSQCPDSTHVFAGKRRKALTTGAIAKIRIYP